tara:strand:+ start:1725 stop:2600 length:876 start_codon:yes stop_codon:yes gene_type:complete
VGKLNIFSSVFKSLTGCKKGSKIEKPFLNRLLHMTVCRLLFFIILLWASPGYCNDSDQLFDMIKQYWSENGDSAYLKEKSVSKRSHLLQSAHLARMVGAPEHVIIGLLLEQAGSLENEAMDENLQMDRLDALWARENAFPESVVDWLSRKTLLKIVLCDRESAYCQHIPSSLKQSIPAERKKLITSEHDIEHLLSRHDLEALLAARRCVDMAILEGFSSREEDITSLLPDFESYRQMFKRVREGKGHAARNGRWVEALKLLQEGMWEDIDAFLVETKLYTQKHFQLAVTTF